MRNGSPGALFARGGISVVGRRDPSHSIRVEFHRISRRAEHRVSYEARAPPPSGAYRLRLPCYIGGRFMDRRNRPPPGFEAEFGKPVRWQFKRAVIRQHVQMLGAPHWRPIES